MSLISLPFLAFALAAIMVFGTVRAPGPRQILFLIANVAFLATMVAAPLQLAALIGFVAIGYAAIWLVERVRVRYVIPFWVIVLVCLFVWLKRYPGMNLLPGLPFAVTLVGLSYIQFRVLHLVIDVGQGVLQRPSVLNYLNYLLHFPALLSGPIHRYDDFQPQIAAPRRVLGWDEVEPALNRIILGVLMVAVLGALTNEFGKFTDPIFTDHLTQGSFAAALWLLTVKSGVFLYNIFFNFAGSMEIVIPLSLLLGIRLPENFNQPFRASNFLDLWNRWHITLSNWLKFYLFNSALRVLGARFATRTNMPYLGVIAFFITFLVIGVWHGPTWMFVVYGFLLAMGVSLNRLWQIWLPKWIGKDRYKALQKAPWYYQLSRSAALSYLAVCQGAFWLDAPMIARLLSPAGIALGILAWFALIAIGIMIGVIWDQIAARCDRIWPPLDADSEGSRPRSGLMLALGIGALASMVIAATLVGATGYLALSSMVRSAYVVTLIGGFLLVLAFCAGTFDRPFAAFRARRGPSGAMNLTACWFAAKIFLVLLLTFLLSSATPELIYKAF